VSIRDQPEAAANTSGIVAEQSRDGFTCCTSSEQRFCRLEAVRSMNLLEIDPATLSHLRQISDCLCPALPQVRGSFSVGLTGFEPATPCLSTRAATVPSSFAETCVDLHKHLTAATRLLLHLDRQSGLLTEYLGNKCGTLAAFGSTSNEVTGWRTLRPSVGAMRKDATPPLRAASNRPDGRTFIR